MQKKENRFTPKKTNLEINYEEFYDKENTNIIVILHGWGGSSMSWLVVGEILRSSGFNVIIPDLPGFGKTKLNRVFDLEEYAVVVEEFLKTLNLDKSGIILWGHSNGGSISIKIANRGKINIERLILNNSAGIRNDKKRSIKRIILNKLIKPFKILKKIRGFEKLRKYFYRAIGSHDYLNSEKTPFLKETYKKVISEDLKEEIKKINIDTLLIWGEKDTYTPLRDGYFMRENIKNSKLVVLDNETHGIHIKNPKRLVESFLQNI